MLAGSALLPSSELDVLAVRLRSLIPSLPRTLESCDLPLHARSARSAFSLSPVDHRPLCYKANSSLSLVAHESVDALVVVLELQVLVSVLVFSVDVGVVVMRFGDPVS